MRGLVSPSGSPAVKRYRFEKPAEDMGLTVFDKSPGKGKSLQHAFEPWLEENGVQWDVVWTGDYTDEMLAFLGAFRELGSRIVADVDDYFEEVPSGNMSMPSWFGSKKRLYRELLKSADTVTASTPFLADRYGGHICPNYLDPSDWDWPHRPTKSEDECVILMAAGSGRAGDYLAREKEFEALLELPNTKFVFMGSMPYWALKYPPARVVWCRWVPLEHYPRMLRWIAPDVMVSPMLHNDFNLAKSSLKWLESAGAGACFVGERWGEYERTVEDGVTGVLADGADEWRERMVEICSDADMRRRIADAGRGEVYSRWVWDAVGPLWRRAVLGVEDERPEAADRTADPQDRHVGSDDLSRAG